MRREIEHRWRELGEFVREQRRLGQLSLRRLSELSGISNPYLSQIERGLRRPSAQILQQLARALQISAESLYVRAGILEDRSQGDDLVGAIRRAPELSEDQKRTLIHVYLSFRAENPRRAWSAAAEPARAVDPGSGTDSGPDVDPGPGAAGAASGAGADEGQPPSARSVVLGGDPAGDARDALDEPHAGGVAGESRPTVGG